MAYTAEYWEYDARLLRRWNTDPIEYEWQSTYACFNNNPIYYADPFGLKGEGGGGKNKGSGVRANTNKDRKGPKGTEAPNGGTRNGDGSVSNGEALCPKCGTNGEDIYGIPDEIPPASQPQDGAEEGSSILDIANDVIIFADGLTNAFVTNHAAGFRRYEKSDLVTKYGYDQVRIAQYGQLTGDILSTAAGIFEIGAGTTITEFGAGLAVAGGPPGIAVGVPVATVGIAIAGEGAVTTGTSIGNGIKTAIDLMNSDDTGKQPAKAAEKANSGTSPNGKASTAANNKIGSNAKKMNEDDLANFFGNKAWHKSSAKRDYLKRFSKQLKGDTNADFYIDKTTNEVLLRSNKSGNWIQTGDFIK